LPAIDKYKPEYYRLDTSSCGRDVSASVLWDEIQISSIASKSLISSSYEELKNEETLVKDTMSVLSYCEMALYGISESLQHSNI
jgi:thiazole synthase ThiGH ThiG subunit